MGFAYRRSVVSIHDAGFTVCAGALPAGLSSNGKRLGAWTGNSFRRHVVFSRDWDKGRGFFIVPDVGKPVGVVCIPPEQT